MPVLNLVPVKELYDILHVNIRSDHAAYLMLSLSSHAEYVYLGCLSCARRNLYCGTVSSTVDVEAMASWIVGSMFINSTSAGFGLTNSAHWGSIHHFVIFGVHLCPFPNCVFLCLLAPFMLKNHFLEAIIQHFFGKL